MCSEGVENTLLDQSVEATSLRNGTWMNERVDAAGCTGKEFGCAGKELKIRYDQRVEATSLRNGILDHVY